MKKKDWAAKFNSKKEAEIKVIDKDFWGQVSGDKMLIASPSILQDYLLSIPKGRSVSLETLRKDLAASHQADFTCPLTTGIFLRIVAEYNYEKLQNGGKLANIAPFWRIINSKSPLAKKLSFGIDFLNEQRQREGI